LLYLLIQAKFANSLTAFITLGFAFLFCWVELTIYIYSMLYRGTDFWDDQFEELDRDEDESPTFGDDFEFPETAAYFVPSTNMPQGRLLIYLGRAGSDSSLGPAMGTSVPISINTRRYSVVSDTEYSRSLVYHRRHDFGDQYSKEIYQCFLQRHADLVGVVKQVKNLDFSSALNTLQKKSRHQYIPRFAFQLTVVLFLLIRSTYFAKTMRTQQLHFLKSSILV
jgi:hypothetical protein